MNPSSRQQGMGMVAFTVILITVAVLTMYFPLAANIPINILLPLGVLIFGKFILFERIKILLLIPGRILIVITVLGFMSGGLLVAIIFWLLRLNILEATLQDLKTKRYFNAASGVLLIASSWSFSGYWNGVYYLTVPWETLFWILAYTLWNWNFVLLNFPRAVAVYHIGVLTAPLLFCLFTLEQGYWLILRAATLTLAGCGQIIYKNKILHWLHNDKFERATEPIMGLKVQGLIFALNLGFLAIFYGLLFL